MDPRALREWAMAPMAATLGLTAALQGNRPGLPVRCLVTDVMHDKDRLPRKTVYVGRGNFHHRLSTTKWRSPWTPGHNCDTSEWLAKYIIHIRTSNLWDSLHELQGCQLACDCPMDQMCEADVLIGLYFDAAQPGADPTRRGADGRWAATAALLQGIQSLPKAVSLPVMSQEGLVLAFCKLFPSSVVPELQVRHGGGPHQQCPVQHLPRMASSTG